MKSLIITTALLFSANSFADTKMLTIDDLIGNPNGTIEPVITSTEMDSLTPADRKAVRKATNNSNINPYIQKHCTTQRDGTKRVDEKCQAIDVRGGDPNFRPEIIDKRLPEYKFSQISKNAKVEVHTKCEGSQFQTRVLIDGKPFVNPHNNQKIFRTSPGQWNRVEPPYKLDSKGKFVRDLKGNKVQLTKEEYASSACDKNPRYCTDFRRKKYRESYRTRLPISKSSEEGYGATGDINQWHVVGDAKAYEGAKMPYAVWLNDSGHAYHAGPSGSDIDGYPASAGCFRLDRMNAKGLFNLTRRVGTRNMKFFWHGYKNKEGHLCDRPLAAKPPVAAGVSPARSKASKENIISKFGGWLRRTFKKKSKGNPFKKRSTDR